MNGGGAFFLIFVLFTIFIGLPMLISEFIIGRGAGREAVSAYDHLAPKSSWRIIGRLGVIGCFLLLSFYSVVGGRSEERRVGKECWSGSGSGRRSDRPTG